MAPGSFIRRPRWQWWAGGALAVVVVLLVLFRVLLPGIASRALSGQLGTPVHIAGLTVSFLGDRVVADGVRIAQPAGFGDEELLRIGKLHVVGWRGALRSPREIDEIRVENLELALVLKDEGGTNVGALFASGPKDSTAEAAEEADADPGKDGEGFSALVRSVSFSSVGVKLRSELGEGQEHQVEFDGGELTIDRLAWGNVGEIEPGEIELTGGIVQGDSPRAEVYVAGRQSDLGKGALNLRLSARITGCLFETFVPLAPDNTGAILGGEGFDADAEMRQAGGVLELRGETTTSNLAHYGFSMHGPSDSLDVELPNALLSVTSRMRGSAGRLMRSTIGSGKEIVEGALKSAGELGKGGLSAAGELVKGAGQTSAGLLTADEEKLKSGAASMTTGAGHEVTDAVAGSKDEITSTGSDTAGAIGSDPGFEKWLGEILERHAERIEGLLDSLRAEPFPPGPER